MAALNQIENIKQRRRQRSEYEILLCSRTGLSSDNIGADDDYSYLENGEDFEKLVIVKSEAAKRMLHTYISNFYLFKCINREQTKLIIDAMKKVYFNTGSDIIKQGDVGDFFYVIEEGEAEATFLKANAFKPKLLRRYSKGECFGELALLHNCPRAATIKAITDCRLWALDRSTFRAVLANSTTATRINEYEEFLGKIPLLKILDSYQRSALAEVLETRYFNPKDCIIAEGDLGDEFFILVEGEAMASFRRRLLERYKCGDYFGELALLRDAPRAATVTAMTACKTFVINRDQFKIMVEMCFIYPEGLTDKIPHALVMGALKLLKGRLEDY